jgi:hypothetical protein
MAPNGDRNCATSLRLPGVGESTPANGDLIDADDMVFRRSGISSDSSCIGSRSVWRADPGPMVARVFIETVAPSNGLEVAGRLGGEWIGPR